jgi:hypothetical protein
MKIYNFLGDEPTTVKDGKEGIDKVPATVQPGSFIVPKDNAPLAVNLTKGEVVVPPSKVPAMDAAAKSAGMPGINALAPNSASPVPTTPAAPPVVRTVPSYTKANDWNNFLIYFNDRVKQDGITDEELDKGDGAYAKKVYEEYAKTKGLAYEYDPYTKEMQQYWNDVYNSNDPLALQNVKGRYTKEQLSAVDGRVGSLTRNYYAPTINQGRKYAEERDKDGKVTRPEEIIDGYRGLPDPYNGGISVYDTNNMTADEAKKYYLKAASNKINKANQDRQNVPGFVDGGFAEGEKPAPLQPTGLLPVPEVTDWKDKTQTDNYVKVLSHNNAILSQNTADTQAQIGKTQSYELNNTTLINPALGSGAGAAQPAGKPSVEEYPFDTNPYAVPETQGNDKILSNSERIQQLIGATTPKFDEEKANRLKRISGVNAIGQAISTAFSGAMGARGGPILNTNTDITPKALEEYKAMLAEDKGNQYRTKLAQAQAGIQAMKEQAANELENKRFNQKQMAEVKQAIAKFDMDKYHNNLKYRREMDMVSAKNGFEWDKLNQGNEWNKEAAAKKFENDRILHNSDNAAALARVKVTASGNALTSSDGTSLISYWDPKTGERKTMDRAMAMDIVGKALKEVDSEGNKVYDIKNLVTEPDKYNPERLGIGFADLLAQYGDQPPLITPYDPLGIISGKATTKTGGYSGSPAPQAPAQQTKTAPAPKAPAQTAAPAPKQDAAEDPFKKYGGSIDPKAKK